LNEGVKKYGLGATGEWKRRRHSSLPNWKDEL
jgi:hypothetical protein